MFKHISYKEKLQRAKEELYNTRPDDIIKRGWKEWDNMLGGIYGGKIYVVGAESGGGKSTFINQVCHNVSNQGWRVVKYSLEDRMEDIGKEELFYQVNRLRYIDGLIPYERNDFVNGVYRQNQFKEHNYYVEKAFDILSKKKIIELDKEKQVGINELCILMEEECKKGAKFFSIDHLHYFEKKTNDRYDLEIENTMHRLNEIVRKYNVVLFLVAHYKKLHNSDPTNDSFKDASGIKQVANIIIHIIRDFDGGDTEFRIGKMRGPIKPDSLFAEFDISKYEYSFALTKEQEDLNDLTTI